MQTDLPVRARTDPELRVQFRPARTIPDRIFRTMATGSGMLVLALLAAILLYLAVQGWAAVKVEGLRFLTIFEWRPDGRPRRFGVGTALLGTAEVSFLAILLALPVAIALAVLINEYAPRRARRGLTGLVDLLAALPSVIYGLWGFTYLEPHMAGLSRWLSDHLGFIPLFKTGRLDLGTFKFSIFDAGVVLGIMVLPIITSVAREVLSQVPRDHCEAALALGGTRAGMIRRVQLPFARGGIVGGTMLGLGRALGETIAVSLMLSLSFKPITHVLHPGGATLAAMIAVEFGNAPTPFYRKALIAAGLALFALVLAVNMLARFIVARSAPGRRAG